MADLQEYDLLLNDAVIKYNTACSHVPLNNRHWKKEQITENIEKIYYIRKGCVEITINAEKYLVHSGEMILIPSNSLLSFRLPDPNLETEQDFLHFDAKIGTKSIFEFIEFDTLVIQSSPDVADYFFSELTADNEDPMHRMLHRREILIEFILYFMEKANGHFKTPTATSNIAFDKIIKYIDQHIIDEDCNVNLLASKANVNINHFIREFKKHYGITPGKYMDEVRVDRIKKLLVETTLPINTIASSFGYSSYDVMSKSFKRKTGLTPSEYREKNRQ